MTTLRKRLKAKLLIIPCRPNMIETAKANKLGD